MIAQKDKKEKKEKDSDHLQTLYNCCTAYSNYSNDIIIG